MTAQHRVGGVRGWAVEGGSRPSGGVSCDCEAPSCGTAAKDAETSQKGPFMGAPWRCVPRLQSRVWGGNNGRWGKRLCESKPAGSDPLTAAGAPGPRGGARPCLRRFCLYSHYPTYRPVLVSEARSTPRNTLLILGDAGRESSFLLSVVLHYSPCPARGVGTQTPRGGGSEQNRKQSWAHLPARVTQAGDKWDEKPTRVKTILSQNLSHLLCPSSAHHPPP